MIKILFRRKTGYLYIGLGLCALVVLDLFYWLSPLDDLVPQIVPMMLVLNRNIMNLIIIAGALLALQYALMKIEMEQETKKDE